MQPSPPEPPAQITVACVGSRDSDPDSDSPMQIHVRTKTGTTVTLDGVRAADSVAALKQRVEAAEGIPVATQTLVFNGAQMEDSQTLGECGVGADAVVHCLWSCFGSRDSDSDSDSQTATQRTATIALVVLDEAGENTGRVVDVLVDTGDAGDTVATVKQLIQEQHDIPAARQRLIFSGKPLADDARTLADHNIQDGSHFHLALRPEGSIEVTVKALASLALVFDVQPSDPVARIKQLFHAKQPGVAPAQQRLIVKGRLLDDERTVAENGLVDGTTVHLLIADRTTNRRQVIVHMLSGHSFTLDVEPSDTLEIAKQKILDQQGFAVAEQCLIYASQELESLDAVPDGATIQLVLRLRRIHISVRTLSDRSFTVAVDASDTVEAAKQRIHEQEGIALERIRLIAVWANRELRDDEVLSECGVEDGVELRLIGPAPTS